VKGPVTSQAPSKGPVAAQAPAVAAPVTMAAAPRLPSTGTGGLLPQPEQDRTGVLVGVGAVLLVAAAVTLGRRLWMASRVL
jgi:hypothetical protein